LEVRKKLSSFCTLIFVLERLTPLAFDHVAGVPPSAHQHSLPAMNPKMAKKRNSQEIGDQQIPDIENHSQA
jgi:hypothetical protein